MASLNIGDVIKIKCEVKNGPFSDEKLVTLDTVDGPITGFVSTEEIQKVDGEWRIRCVVREVHENTLEVMVNGSFFTTNGLANLPLDAALAA